MILTRETKFSMMLDFTAGTIGYMDYVGFLQGANEDYMDVSGFPTEDNDGNPFLMQCTRTMILYGDTFELHNNSCRHKRICFTNSN